MPLGRKLLVEFIGTFLLVGAPMIAAVVGAASLRHVKPAEKPDGDVEAARASR